MTDKSRMAVLRMGVCLASLMVAAGCAVGPDFSKPKPPEVSDYTAAPLPAATTSTPTLGGGAQRFDQGADLAGDWWTLFHSKALSDLVAQALANNHDLKAAEAALRAAQENTAAGRGAYWPKVSAGFSASRQQDPSGALAPVPSTNASLYNLFTPTVSVSYVPDVFGLNRRTVESLAAQEQGVRYQMIAAYNTLTSNVAVTAIQIGATQMQIAATRQLIDANTRMVTILQEQFSRGYASGLDLQAQKSQLAGVIATLPPLIKQQAQLRDQLAVLVGRYPSQAPNDDFDLASLTLPADLPVSLPSKLVEQRPDVLQAEANLHSASAQIGVAVANRLPNIQLTATAGNTALALNQLFTPGTDFWNIGAALTAPIFDGGTLLHQEGAARANFDQAAEQYRSTVLTAFQNVADSLTALQQDAEGLKAAADAEAAAKATLDITQHQREVGYANMVGLLNAEQAYQQARITLINAQSARYADTAALFLALGGGWWNQTSLARDEHGNP